jgi:hypothetical protein
VKVPFSGPQRSDPTAAWTNEEVAARLEHVFEMCTAEYHFVPGEDDWTALRKACALIRAVVFPLVDQAPRCLRCGRQHGPDKDCL